MKNIVEETPSALSVSPNPDRLLLDEKKEIFYLCIGICALICLWFFKVRVFMVHRYMHLQKPE